MFSKQKLNCISLTYRDMTRPFAKFIYEHGTVMKPRSYAMNSLPNDKILVLSKSEAFADNNLNSIQMMEFFFNRVENIFGKRRKCWLSAFSRSL